MTIQGVYITPLDPPDGGIRLAVKDLFDTAGIRTTYGSAVFRDHVPDLTAEAVVRLEAAGYVNVGKSNLHEFAWGITSENEHYGTVPNPIAPGRIAGGSSGGSAAALAAGLADAGLGTDSGGSIRIPAACCGIAGFKPTHGFVPMAGCFPLAPSFDHAGPMARDVAGCALMMEALVPDLSATYVGGLGELKVGVAWTEHADPLIRARVEEAAALFPHAEPVDVPLSDPAVYPFFQREAATVHAALWERHRELYGENVAVKIERALKVKDEEVIEARSARERYRARVAELMDGFDLIVTPTLTTVAPRTGIGDLALRDTLLHFTLPWNTVGAPALALPCGAAEDGLPASVQLVGKPGQDALVLAAGSLLEAALAA